MLVGRLLADRNDEVRVATKFGIVFREGSYAGMQARNDPAYAAASCDASLQRLGVDVIDLFYLHRRDRTVPVEDVVGPMAELVRAGKVRQLGLSEATSAELRAAHRAHPVTAVQSEWSLWSRDVEAHVLPACVELGVGFVPYSPLGRGFLAGAVAGTSDLTSDFRGGLPRFREAAREANLRLLASVEAVAVDLGATLAQVALAWLRIRALDLGVSCVPIPGTRSPARVDENLASLDLELGADTVRLPRRAGGRCQRLAIRCPGRRAGLGRRPRPSSARCGAGCPTSPSPSRW